ncbi:MAG: hypothetical protein JO032_07265 [Alphaproteobacteria bacterium]|nr:hypothetical protein [Alphaproteobacteria bacterium]
MFKIVIAFFIVFGAIVWGQRYAGTWITRQAAEMPPRDDLPTATQPVPSLDPDEIRRSINRPIGVVPATRRPN